MKLDLIFEIIMCIVLFVSGVIIGGPITNNTEIINICVMSLAIVYIIYYTVKNRKSIIKNKIDIFMILLTLSSFLALTFKTFTTTNGSIEYILRYSSILGMYFVSKEIVKNNNKIIKYIAYTICIANILIFFIGIDDLTYKKLNNILEKLEIMSFYPNGDQRMISTFRSANTFGTCMAISFLFSICYYLKSEKKIEKLFNCAIMVISESGIILSYSRGTWVILGLIGIIYYFTLEKSKRAKYIRSVCVSSVLAVIYTVIFNKILITNNFIISWVSIPVTIFIAILVNWLLDKYGKNLKKVNFLKYKKTVIFLLVIFVIVIVAILDIGMKMTRPLNLFNNKTDSNEYIHRVYNIQGGQTYKCIFEINAKQTTEFFKNYEIKLEEKNKYYDTIDTHTIELGNFDGEKELEFNTQENTTDFKITFKSKNNIAQKGFEVKKLIINEKEEALKYAYLPKKIVEKIQNLKISDNSVSERVEFMISGIKEGIDYFWTGTGGDGYQYVEGKYQTYYTFSTEPHSYIVELFAEFGVVGLISIVIIIINVIKIVILNKSNNLEKNTMFIAFLLLLLHSMMDFDMSYMYIMLIFYIMISIFSSEKEEFKYKKRSSILINISFIIFIFIALAVNINKKNIDLDLNMDNIDSKNTESAIAKLEECEKYTELEPYDKQSKNIMMMQCIIRKTMTPKNSLEFKKHIKNIEYMFEKQIDVNKYNIRYQDVIFTQLKEMIDLLEMMKDDELIDEYKNILQKNVEIIKENVDSDKARLTKEERESYKEEINNFYK